MWSDDPRRPTLTPAEGIKTVPITESAPPPPPLRSFASVPVMIVDQQAKLRLAFAAPACLPASLHAAGSLQH